MGNLWTMGNLWATNRQPINTLDPYSLIYVHNVIMSIMSIMTLIINTSYIYIYPLTLMNGILKCLEDDSLPYSPPIPIHPLFTPLYIFTPPIHSPYPLPLFTLTPSPTPYQNSHPPP